MKWDAIFYLCPTCFNICAESGTCHAHSMLRCTPGKPGCNRRRPLEDSEGRMLSRAPRWYLEANGAMQAYAPYTSVPS